MSRTNIAKRYNSRVLHTQVERMSLSCRMTRYYLVTSFDSDLGTESNITWLLTSKLFSQEIDKIEIVFLH